MKIIFGTVMRNVESSMIPLMGFLSDMCSRFPDAHVAIYENNSTDATRSMFPLLQSISPNVRIQSETLSKESQLEACKAASWDMIPCRMELIAAARNKLLDMIHEIGYEDSDLVVLFDCGMRTIDTQILAERLRAFPENIDALFANGLSRNGITYYDMYALRTADRPFGPEIHRDEFWNSLPQICITQPTQVLSAFGGLAIYKGYCLRDNRYSALPTSALDRCMRTWAAGTTMSPSETHYKGGLIGMYLFGTEPGAIFYYNNAGYSYPVVCEHSTFHATLHERGQGRLVIDPALKYYSDH